MQRIRGPHSFPKVHADSMCIPDTVSAPDVVKQESREATSVATGNVTAVHASPAPSSQLLHIILHLMCVTGRRHVVHRCCFITRIQARQNAVMQMGDACAADRVVTEHHELQLLTMLQPPIKILQSCYTLAQASQEPCSIFTHAVCRFITEISKAGMFYCPRTWSLPRYATWVLLGLWATLRSQAPVTMCSLLLHTLPQRS